MVTSNLERREHPSRVFIPLQSATAEGTGLRTDSVIMTDNLATILYSAVAQKLGRLATLAKVNDALRATFGL
jgi:mRNA interferase MazF